MSRYVELRTGAQAHYVEAGPADGPVVMLLHDGLAGSSGEAGWRFMVPALAARGFRVIAPDRPGFGRGVTRPEHWPRRRFLSWKEFVRDLADALGLGTFGIGGNSQGAQTATYFAVQNPERVERMALIACGGFNPTFDIPASTLTRGVPFPVWDGTAESMRDMLTTIVHREDTITDDLVALRTDAAIAQRGSLAAAGDWKRRALADPQLGQALRLVGRLDRLSMPIVYLYGRQDVLSPVQSVYRQEDLLTNVRFFYPDDCGHQGQTDQPEMHNAVVAEFFTSGSVSRATATWAVRD